MKAEEGTKETEPLCGARYRTSPLMCDREPGHGGEHRGYNLYIDEPIFWGDPARVPAFLIAVINAIGEISKQEAIDAIVQYWPTLREGREP